MIENIILHDWRIAFVPSMELWAVRKINHIPSQTSETMYYKGLDIAKAHVEFNK